MFAKYRRVVLLGLGTMSRSPMNRSSVSLVDSVCWKVVGWCEGLYVSLLGWLG